jgi:hypothetical protein
MCNLGIESKHWILTSTFLLCHIFSSKLSFKRWFGKISITNCQVHCEVRERFHRKFKICAPLDDKLFRRCGENFLRGKIFGKTFSLIRYVQDLQVSRMLEAPRCLSGGKSSKPAHRFAEFENFKSYVNRGFPAPFDQKLSVVVYKRRLSGRAPKCTMFRKRKNLFYVFWINFKDFFTSINKKLRRSSTRGCWHLRPKKICCLHQIRWQSKEVFAPV